MLLIPALHIVLLLSKEEENVNKANSKLVIRPSESGSLITQLGIRVGVQERIPPNSDGTGYA